MVVVEKMEVPFSFTTRKKIGKATMYGQRRYAQVRYGEERLVFGSVFYGRRIYGADIYADISDFYGIYKMKKGKERINLIKMDFYVPKNPQTEPQQTNRGKMTAAVAAWQVLTSEQKVAYNKRATHKHYFGYQLFLKEYLLSH